MDGDRPLTGGDLDRWAAGLTPTDAARAAVVVGIDVATLGRRQAAGALSRAFVPTGSSTAAPFVEWRPDVHRFVATARSLADLAGAAELDAGPDPERSFAIQPPPLRLAVAGDIVPADIVPRLLACSGVGSVVLPVARSAGALRRREWRWPLRLGAIDDDLVAALESDDQHRPVPPNLVDVTDIEEDPGPVDLLVVRGPLATAVDQVDAVRPVANIVVVAGDAPGSWPVVDAQLAMLRALTGAVAVVLAPASPDLGELADRVLRTVRFASHGHLLDVAVTAAFERGVLIAGELDALQAAALPEQIRQRARQLEADVSALDDVVVRDRAGPSLSDLGILADGSFDQERHTASAAPPLEADVDAAIDDAAPPRVLQLLVRGASAIPGLAPPAADHVLRVGANEVDVFVGPEEAGAIQGLAMTNTQLGFTESSVTVRLTAVLVPLDPPGPIQRAELDVPRTGRSTTATLAWTIPREARRAQARIMLLHRNRVLQTGLLGGRIGGAPPTLTERVVLWDEFGHLDDRRPFDLAVVLNHDDTGKARLVAHADGQTEQIAARPELEHITGRIRSFLVAAAFLKGTGAKRDEAARRILVDVAVEGRRLHGELRGSLDRLGTLRRIQIVTARPSWFLPLELIYERAAPDDDAELCQRWQAGDECGDACFPGGDEHRVVCPSAFWGMSRVIERHWVDAADPTATTFLVSASPQRRRRTLSVAGAVLAASKKVTKADVKVTKECLGAGVVLATSWDAWSAALADPATPADLLVMMPHTDAANDTLEVSGTTLRGGRVEAARYVTGGRDTHPVVLLFGCDTSGSEENPAGYATLFMQAQAGVVFASLTMLLNQHAAALTQRLAALLLEDGRSARPVGEVVQAFRVAAVRDGLLAALAITAYGDSDWKV